MNVTASSFVSTAKEWLPRPPEHWAVIPFRHAFAASDERNGGEPVGEMLSVSGYRGVVVKDYEFEEQRRTFDELRDYRVVRPGQLAVNTMWLNYTGLGVSEHLGHVSPAYRAYDISDGLDGRFVHHLLRSSVYVAGYTSLLQGIRPNSLQVPTDAFHSIPVLVPLLPEQRIIAAYLDRETARIDGLVERLERLIALLASRRQAVISHAVTKGLDPSAPMKDSGIDWLGEVPAHWEVRKVSQFASVGNGSTPSRDNADYWSDDGFPWLNSGAVNDLIIENGSNGVTSVALKECHLPIVEPGTVVLAITGQGKTRGTASLVGLRCTISQHLAYVQMREPYFDAKFLLRVFQAAYRFLRANTEGAGSTRAAITCEFIGNLRLPCPQIEEQGAIAARLDKEAEKIARSFQAIEKQLGLLRERRAALISAAVTGQIPLSDMAPTQAEAAE